MDRTWLSVSADTVVDWEVPDDERSLLRLGDRGARQRWRRSTVEAAIAALEWQRPPPTEMPMAPGLGIQAIIDQLHLPRVTAIALSHDLAPAGFYGVEANYRNGRARLYVLDLGSVMYPVASDFWPILASVPS